MRVKYDNHPQQWAEILSDPKQLEHSLTWFADDRVDSWRHRRMRELVLPVIAGSKDKKWLTVGDGRYGTDAHYLLAQGVKDVHASDIVDTMLKIGAEKNFISSFSAQNAEDLTFGDEEFDYVYCKESYHHFPRPYMAVYEMLRVCREAVILTEPNDILSPLTLTSSIAKTASRWLKTLTGKKIQHHAFEEAGNYVYTVSDWEIKKLMLGLGLRYCAFKGLNDHYIAGAEQALFSGGTPADRQIKKKIMRMIAREDFLCGIGLKKYALITAIIFKKKPDGTIWKDLQAAGFTCEVLPQNPYH
ncbi:MAG TPA: methyltransferase domain-containing protein [Rhizomicrobium sp.]|nr:methyltransferase domain-containing protein [Rhizomicrobium sp.]